MRKNVYVLIGFLSIFLFNANTAKAQAGNALDFLAAANNRVDIPLLVTTGSYTKEAWINIRSFSTDNNILSGTFGGSAFWIPASASNHLSAGHPPTYQDVVDPDITPLSTGVWYHVAVTYDAGTGTMSLYKNGILAASAVVGAYSETAMYIGSFNAGFVFDGLIDEVRVWNYARSATDITNSMSCSLTGDEPGLLAYYTFDQGSAGNPNPGVTTLNDVQDKCTGANGTLQNFLLTGGNSNWVTSTAPITGTCAHSDANISVVGNSVCIAINDNTPSLTDHTIFPDYGTVATTRTYTIQNTGNATLNISSVTIGGANASDFSVSSAPAATVAGGGSTTFTIAFAGTGTLGLKTATITVNNDDGDEGTFTYTVQGNYAGQGKALAFDGVGDEVTIPNLLTGGSYTKEAWIYSANAPVGNNIVSGGIGGTAFWAPSPFNLTAGHPPTYANVVDPVPLTANTWYHVAVTYDAGTGVMNLYKNGILVSTAAAVGGYAEPTSYIGAFDGGNFFAGRIDEVRIWNVARTALDILNNMNCQLTGDEPNLVAYYDFNNGIAGNDNTGVVTLFDKSDKCTTNNGTLSGFALNGTISNWISDTTVLTGTCTNTFPNIKISGNALCILVGDNTPNVADNTDYGTYIAPGINKTYTIDNTGSTTLNISGISITGTDASMFTVFTAPASTVAPGASTTFVIRFIGSGVDGIKTATVTVNNDDGDEGTYSFDVQGNFQIALPVTFQSFTGVIDRGTIKLTWKTGAEYNNRGFEVLRSPNGNNSWESIGFVPGNTSAQIVNTYNFTDRLPLQGVNAYRLKQVDFNSNYRLSQVITFNIVSAGTSISYYPNPVKDKMTLVFNDNTLLNTYVQINSVTGTVVSKIKLTSNRQEIDLGSLPAGMYLLSFNNGTVARIVKH